MLNDPMFRNASCGEYISRASKVVTLVDLAGEGKGGGLGEGIRSLGQRVGVRGGGGVEERGGGRRNQWGLCVVGSSVGWRVR